MKFNALKTFLFSIFFFLPTLSGMTVIRLNPAIRATIPQQVFTTDQRPFQGRAVHTDGHIIYLGEQRLSHYAGGTIYHFETYNAQNRIMALNAEYPTLSSYRASRISIWSENGTLLRSIKLPQDARLLSAQLNDQYDLIIVIQIHDQSFSINIHRFAIAVQNLDNIVTQLQRRQSTGAQMVFAHCNLIEVADGTFALAPNFDLQCSQDWDSSSSSESSDDDSDNESDSDDNGGPADRGETPPQKRRRLVCPNAPRRPSHHPSSENNDDDDSIAGGLV